MLLCCLPRIFVRIKYKNRRESALQTLVTAIFTARLIKRPRALLNLSSRLAGLLPEPGDAVGAELVLRPHKPTNGLLLVFS